MKPKSLGNSKFYHILGTIFVFCLLISNIAEMKLLDVFGYAQIGGGTLFFPLLYVLNDVLTEVYGFSASRRIIWSALCFNLLFTMLMYVVMMLPSGPDWQEKDAFETIFALSPRIVLGSIISYFIGELINSTIISALKMKFEGKIFAVRALFSTLIASFIESVLFAYIAFFNRMPHDELLKMICLLTISKVLYELIFMPITISLVKYLKRAENLDVYEKPSFKKILPSWE
jgi:hypothetical protein